MRATAKDLRLRTRAVFAAVDRGEEVIVTYRGKPRAKLTGLSQPAKGRPGRSRLFGIWKDDARSADVAAFVNRLRTGRF